MSRSKVVKLSKDMKKNGYDSAQPITTAVGEGGTTVIIDGHHRAAAAAVANISVQAVSVGSAPSAAAAGWTIASYASKIQRMIRPK